MVAVGMFLLVLALPASVVGAQVTKTMDHLGLKTVAEYPQQKK